MKMAKPSEQDIDAGGNLMALLNDIDSGYYPFGKDDDDAPMFFDEDDPKHLRQFYDAVKATLDSAPGWQGRVIGGMCYVIMYDKNEIVDPDSDVIDLHPKLVKALEVAEQAPVQNAEEVRRAALDPDQLYMAVIDCSHVITEDSIVLHRNSAIEGNALSQLSDRLAALASKEAAAAEALSTDKQNAARYLFLRDQASRATPHVQLPNGVACFSYGLDEVIDAATAAQQSAQCEKGGDDE